MDLIDRYAETILDCYHRESYGIAIFKKYRDSYRFAYISQKDSIWSVALNLIQRSLIDFDQYGIYIAIEMDKAFQVHLYQEDTICNFDNVKNILVYKKTI